MVVQAKHEIDTLREAAKEMLRDQHLVHEAHARHQEGAAVEGLIPPTQGGHSHVVLPDLHGARKSRRSHGPKAAV